MLNFLIHTNLKTRQENVHISRTSKLLQDTLLSSTINRYLMSDHIPREGLEIWFAFSLVMMKWQGKMSSPVCELLYTKQGLLTKPFLNDVDQNASRIYGYQKL